MFAIYIYCDMITIITLINISTTSQNHHIFSETVKIYSLRNFKYKIQSLQCCKLALQNFILHNWTVLFDHHLPILSTLKGLITTILLSAPTNSVFLDYI